MGFVKTPVKGMNDFLPREMALRQKVLAAEAKRLAPLARKRQAAAADRAAANLAAFGLEDPVRRAEEAAAADVAAYTSETAEVSDLIDREQPADFGAADDIFG